MNTEKTSVHNMPSSIVDAQLQRLLEIVEDFKRQQCEVLLEQARQQSQQVISHTYRNARTRLRTYILEDRQQLQQSLASVRAKQHTFVMQQKHQASRIFLNDSWDLLTSKLVQRWQNAKQRQLWVQAIADVAIVSLPASNWQVAYGGEWSKADEKYFLAYISSQSNKTVSIQAGSDIDVGIRIEGGGAVVDGTLQGLLSDRVRIESEILAQCTNCIVHSRASDEQKKQENETQ